MGYPEIELVCTLAWERLQAEHPLHSDNIPVPSIEPSVYLLPHFIPFMGKFSQTPHKLSDISNLPQWYYRSLIKIRIRIIEALRENHSNFS